MDQSTRPTIPAPPSALTPEANAVAAYIRASERVRQALTEQGAAIQALKAFDSRFPVGVAL